MTPTPTPSQTPLAPRRGLRDWLLIFPELHPGRPFQHTVQLLNRIVGSLLALELQLDILLRIVGMPYPNHGTVGTHQSLHRHYRPQSSTASPFTAGGSGANVSTRRHTCGFNGAAGRRFPRAVKLSLRPRPCAANRLRFARHGEDQSHVARAAHRASQPRFQTREREASPACPYQRLHVELAR
jgi:hypothetical protein